MATAQTANLRVLRNCAVVLAGTAALLALGRPPGLLGAYFWTQDAPVIVLLCGLLLTLAAWRPAGTLPVEPPRTAWVIAAAGILALALWAGTHWLLLDYPLTRDEHMAVFDAGIFAHGRLAEPVPPAWRGFTHALAPDFLLDVPGNALLVSGYLPGNALLRAAAGAIADPALANPCLAAVGLLALHDVSRRLFAGAPGAQWVVLAGYALSPQVLAAAMTPYAMTGLLAVNLVWLALFLRGRMWQHGLAMVLGAFAMGLHQFVFHPLFAAPFLLVLPAQRRWTLFGCYAAVYAGALLFWLDYPSLVVAGQGVVAHQGSAGGVAPFIVERIVPLLTSRANGALRLMEHNLLRFVTWSPLFILPLAAVAWPDVRENRGMALPLFGGILLRIVAMLIILPSQGHGWGYRYLHGLIGNVSLLAGYGLVRWQARDARGAEGTMLVLGGATALLSLPFLLVSQHLFVAPYARASALIARQHAEFVVIDTDTNKAAIDQVRNRADLLNRPLVFASHLLSAPQVDALCTRGRVAMLTPAQLGLRNLDASASPVSARFGVLVERARSRGCLVAPSG